MGIREFIAKQKDAHQRQRLYSVRSQTSEARLKNYELEQLRQKEQKLTQAHAETQRLERDIATTQQARGPSGIQRFGQGLAKVMNKTKADVKDAKSKGYMKGIDFGGSKPSNARRAGNTLSRINQGSTGLAFGGSSQGNSNPFSSGQRNLEYGRPAPVVRQTARPKTKTIIRY
jgi:hypothetical protein